MDGISALDLWDVVIDVLLVIKQGIREETV